MLVSIQRAVQRAVQHFRSQMTSSAASKHILGLTVAAPIPVANFVDVVLAHPASYAHYIVESAALCDTAGVVKHELVVYRLYTLAANGGRTYYYVVADRVTKPAAEPPYPNSTAQAVTDHVVSEPTSSLPDPSTMPRPTSRSSQSGSTIPLKPAGDADDRIRMWVPSLFQPDSHWWKGAFGSSSSSAHDLVRIFTYDSAEANKSRQLTLVDVVLALHSVSETAPVYSFRKHNCWWFARCHLLLLCLQQHNVSSPILSPAEINKAFFANTQRVPIPFPDSLSDNVIRSDTITAEMTFITLVRISTITAAYLNS